mgnify:CR=1 FL=1
MNTMLYFLTHQTAKQRARVQGLGRHCGGKIMTFYDDSSYIGEELITLAEFFFILLLGRHYYTDYYNFSDNYTIMGLTHHW